MYSSSFFNDSLIASLVFITSSSSILFHSWVSNILCITKTQSTVIVQRVVKEPIFKSSNAWGLPRTRWGGRGGRGMLKLGTDRCIKLLLFFHPKSYNRTFPKCNLKDKRPKLVLEVHQNAPHTCPHCYTIV